jgi:glycosyltransferase involved in cell wall biosynthesis
MLDEITPLIITYNEAPNIGRVLDRLKWARRIVVIDSGSTDGTLELLRSYRQVEIFTRQFTSFADQCNYGLAQITSPWVLSLDADYELSDGLIVELRGLWPSVDVSGLRAKFIYRIHGAPLRASLYPPRTVLYRPDRARYQDEGHGHRVVISGQVNDLNSPIFHDDRKPLGRWISSQQRYAVEEASYLLQTPRELLKPADKVRLMVWPAPFVVFLYTLLIKGTVLDGRPGWYYALQRLLAEIMLALELSDRRLRTRVTGDRQEKIRGWARIRSKTQP